MNLSPDHSSTGLLPGSKKIKKLKATLAPLEFSSEDGRNVRKYRTYTKSQKQKIVTDLQQALKSRFEGKDGYSADELVRYLEGLDKGEYNQLIENILSRNAPEALRKKKNKLKWQKDLKQWRRQLKVWIKNVDKPERRGNARVVSREKIPEFKEKISAVLKEMPIRSFALLRPKAISILEEMHNSESTVTGPFNRNTFSKHFWYDFKKSHPDIEALYGSIKSTGPLETVRKSDAMLTIKPKYTFEAVCKEEPMFNVKTMDSEMVCKEEPGINVKCQGDLETMCKEETPTTVYKEEPVWNIKSTEASEMVCKEEPMGNLKGGGGLETVCKEETAVKLENFE